MPFPPRMVALGAAIVIALGALAVGLSRGDDQPDIVCIALDSTNPSIAGLYLGRLELETRRAAHDGATVKAFAFAGAAKVESVPTLQEFEAGASRRAVRTAVHDVRRAVSQASIDLQTAQAGTRKRAAGSGVLEAITKADEGSGCQRIVVLSDGLDRRAFDAYGADVLTRSGRADILDSIRQRNLLPELDGVRAVEFPYGGIVPTGSEISKDPARVDALELTWTGIVDAAGSTLRWGQ